MYPYLGTFIFPVYTYGVFLSIGFLGAILLALSHGRYLGIPVTSIIDLAFWFMVSSIAGARFLYVLLYPDQFPTVVSWFELNKGGLVFFGGFLTTVGVVVAFSRYSRISLRQLGDLIAPSLALGHAVGRLGCFFNGCCYGKPTTMAWGMVFPNLADKTARLPTQLLESGFLFLLVVLGTAVVRLRSAGSRWFPGSVWGAYLMAYGAFRFTIEFWRDDNRGGFFTPLHLSVSQLFGLVACVAGLLWLAACQRARSEVTHG